MMLLEKPPIQWGRTVFQGIVLAMLLLISGGGVLMGLGACARFDQARRDAVTVDAVISNVDCHYDSEDGDEYDVYIRYTYEGESYEAQQLNDTSDKSWMDKIGQTVSVEINPHQPQELISSLRSTARGIVFGLWILNVAVRFMALPVRNSWTATYGSDRSFVAKDLETKLRRRWLWQWGVLTGTEMIVLALVFPRAIPGWTLLLGAVFLLLGIKGYRRFKADLDKVHSGAFIIRSDTLVEKYEEPDNDGGIDQVLVYSNGTDTWHKVASLIEYRYAQIGQTQSVVYLEGEKRPALEL